MSRFMRLTNWCKYRKFVIQLMRRENLIVKYQQTVRSVGMHSEELRLCESRVYVDRKGEIVHTEKEMQELYVAEKR